MANSEEPDKEARDAFVTPRGVVAFWVAMDIIAAAVIALGVFGGLPVRIVVVEVFGATAIALQLACAVLIVRGSMIALAMARRLTLLLLTMGLLVLGLLGASIGYLAQVYAPTGPGGVVLFGLVALLVFPYFVALPIGKLLWLRARPQR